MLEVPLTQGQVSIIDDVDSDLLDLKWYAAFNSKYSNGGTYFAQRKQRVAKGVRCIQYLHRCILTRAVGRELLSSEETDHINRDTLDNRRENLRIASRAQNQRNQNKQKNNTSGYIGVSWNKAELKWQVSIRADNVKIHLGYFTDALKAARAYDDAATKYFGEFAVLNSHYE